MTGPHDENYDTALNGPSGSDPLPMGSNVSREDSADHPAAGTDSGVPGQDPAHHLPPDDEPLPDDGLG